MRLLALAGALLAFTPASAAARPCYPTYCSHTLTVGQSPVHWATPKVRELETLEARYKGRVLSYDNRGCVSYASGYGIVVKFNGCGPGLQRVRVTAISLRNSPVRVRIVYG
jgi:hypothetical protein